MIFKSTITLSIFVLGLMYYNNIPVYQEKTNTYSNEDCLRANIFFEAKGESFKGKQAVAKVTYNRLYKKLRDNPSRPSNICSVVFEPKQFSWTHQVNKDVIQKVLNTDTRLLNKKDNLAYQEAVKVSLMPYNELRAGISDKVLYYHSIKVKPKWSYKMQKYKVIQNHVFYKG